VPPCSWAPVTALCRTYHFPCHLLDVDCVFHVVHAIMQVVEYFLPQLKELIYSCNSGHLQLCLTLNTQDISEYA